MVGWLGWSRVGLYAGRLHVVSPGVFSLSHYSHIIISLDKTCRAPAYILIKCVMNIKVRILNSYKYYQQLMIIFK